jgi:hypothetical protein
MKNTAARKRKQVSEWYLVIGVDPHKRLSENTFFDAFLENFVRKKSENFLKN